MKSEMVAIVVPLSLRPTLTPDEEISLRHLVHFLGKYDKYFVTAKSMQFERPGFEVARFPDRFFGSKLAHARLQVTEEFYARFRSYKYILIYHLDALVFSDQLEQWCRSGFDYIGAPWLHCEDSPWVKRPRVGNSGFTLMNIESTLNVMHSRQPTVDPDEYWSEFCAANPGYRQWMNLPRKYLKRLRFFNGVKREMRHWPYQTDGLGNTDLFWSDRASKYWPDFKIPPVETGLKFAFEVAPRMCFQLNGNQLPFGCHAWPFYDREFWEPYLLK
jgi:hypothetical protein